MGKPKKPARLFKAAKDEAEPGIMPSPAAAFCAIANLNPKSANRAQRERRGGDAGKPVGAATKQKKWTPPPWDERPLRKSDKKSQGVTNPYASKPTKARVTARR